LTGFEQSYQLGVADGPAGHRGFDGDGRTDLSVWRPSHGTWKILLSSTGYDRAQWQSYQWGLPTDIPLRPRAAD
jgi:hypothetical protein